MKPTLAIQDDAPALVGRHVHEAPAFDNGEPVRVTPADTADEPREIAIDTLLESGFTIEQAELAAGVCSQIFASNSGANVAAGVRAILERAAQTRLGKTPQFIGLLAVFSGRPIDQLARETGHSRQAIDYHVAAFRRLFFAERAIVGKTNK